MANDKKPTQAQHSGLEMWLCVIIASAVSGIVQGELDNRHLFLISGGILSGVIRVLIAICTMLTFAGAYMQLKKYGWFQRIEKNEHIQSKLFWAYILLFPAVFGGLICVGIWQLVHGDLAH